MKKDLNNLIDILNNIVKGFKNINLDGCSEPSQVTVAYRSIFGNEYKDINKEIIAKKLSEKDEWKAFYNFLNDRDCLWMDLIGCDSFSDKIKKQIFFATISMDDNVAKERGLLLDAYKKIIKSIPLDLFIQLFFIDREKFINGFKELGSIEEKTIENLGETLLEIQNNGFVLSFSSKQDKESKSRNNEYKKNYPQVLNVCVAPFNDIGRFEAAINSFIKKEIISFPSEMKNLLEYIKLTSEATCDTLSLPGDVLPHNTDVLSTPVLSEFATIIARFNKSLNKEGLRFLYFIPNHCPDGSIGLFCFGSKADNLLDSNTIDELRLLSYNLLYPYVSSYKSAWDSKQVAKESIKSAKAAIMSRNMSHNLGSHVMAYLKNDLRNVPAIFGSSVLHHLFPDHIKEETSKVSGEVELPFLVGLGNFIGYLQERQDYIATIASSYIPSFSPVNFKDSVYDELNPDLRFERHHGIDPNNHNRPQNILLSYIAKSEKLSRLKSTGGHNHDILLGFKHKGNNEPFGIKSSRNVSGHPTLTHMRLVNFALPGGTVGRQAIFSIVENIIRNAAKHNNVQGDLHLIFEAIDGEELKNNSNAFEDSIFSPLIRRLYKCSEHIEDLIILTITDNQECQDTTIDKLRRALREPYVGPNAQLNKGIKEIRISSTWLRGEDDDSLFAPCPLSEEEPIVENRKAPAVVIEKSKEGNLRYAICLKKTYEFALVYENEDRKEDFRNKFDIKDESCKLVSADTIINSDTCYEYILAENNSVFEKIRPYVSNRCINAKKILIKSTSLITPDKIYQVFTGIGKKSPCIVIADNKVDGIVYKEKIKGIKQDKFSQQGGTYKYMYRSHHFSDVDFGAYWIARADGKIKGNYECIDAISGDNSSDRLVRREILDKKWYIGHLYAMQSRVAIFDERLFQIIHGLDESQMTSGSYAATKFWTLCQEGKWPQKSLTDRKLRDFATNELLIKQSKVTEFCELYRACSEDPNGCKEPEGLTNRKQMIKLIKNFCFKFKYSVKGRRHLTAAYSEKGVDIYTIIPLGKEECIIVGNTPYEYRSDYQEKEKKEKPVYLFSFKPIARIWRDKDRNFRIDGERNYRYLSIHQGLIDKMYTEFGIEEDENEKKALLHVFYNGFMTETVTDNNAFMPRMTIHSGRGHITSKDMPCNQPFLQYSAIEHAVLDCKYSLVELLDFAKYKES